MQTEAVIVVWSLVCFLPSQHRLRNVFYSRVKAESNMGYAALFAQIMKERAQASGATVILDAI